MANCMRSESEGLFFLLTLKGVEPREIGSYPWLRVLLPRFTSRTMPTAMVGRMGSGSRRIVGAIGLPGCADISPGKTSSVVANEATRLNRAT